MDNNLVAKTGNESMAEAMRQINPDVVAAYPITPATEIVQIFAQYVSDGLVNTEFVAVESEHSAMSACIGASAAGARVMTGTSSQGLALMNEMIYIAAGLRLPIVLCEVNRALSAPINIHGDHSDTMNVRDAGWVQIFSENSQEAYDNVIQAIKIAEKSRIPVMVTTDGFIISHCMEVISMLSDSQVQGFIGPYKPERYLLDIDKPHTIGAIDLQDYYFEHRKVLADAVKNSKNIILEVAKEYKTLVNRNYDLFEKYKTEDAEVVLVMMGSTAGTTKFTVDKMREKGKKVGLIKIRVYRPFPEDELKKEMQKFKTIGVLDKSDGCAGKGGPLFDDVKSAIYDLPNKPAVYDFIYGLGGRDIKSEEIETIYNNLLENKQKEKVTYIGVRE